MSLQTAAVSSEHPNAPTPRTSSSYVFDALAMAVYVVAITVCAIFLDVPYPGILALAIAFVSLAVLNTRITTPARADQTRVTSDPLSGVRLERDFACRLAKKAGRRPEITRAPEGRRHSRG